MTREKSTQEASARPRRTPVGSRNRLFLRNKEPGFIYRIVNDVDDNIQLRMDQGYEIVPAEKTGRVGDKRVDSASTPGSSSYISVGQGTKAVVMRIKEEYYKEDQSVKQAQIDDLEQAMKTKDADYGTFKIER